MYRAGTGARARLDPGRIENAERLVDLVRDQLAPFAIAHLLQKRQTRQRIEPVVEVDQQLAPLDGLDLVGRGDGQPRNREQVENVPASALDDHLAGRAAMEMGFVLVGHVEFDDAGEDRTLRQGRPQRRHAADAVLQADDGRPIAAESADLLGDLRGRAAFHRDQDKHGAAQDLRVRRGVEAARRHRLIGTGQIRQPHAARGQHIDDPLPAEKADIASGEHQMAADEAADIAGAGDDDAGIFGKRIERDGHQATAFAAARPAMRPE